MRLASADRRMRISRRITAIAASQKSEGCIMVYQSYPPMPIRNGFRESKVITRTLHAGAPLRPYLRYKFPRHHTPYDAFTDVGPLLG